MALKEFLQHSKGSRGVLGQASKVASKHVRVRRQASKQADKHQGGIQSEPCPVEACFNGEKF